MKSNALLSLAVGMASAMPAMGIGIVSGPYLQNVTADEATVVWRTDVDALGWVEVAPDDSLHFYAEERPRYYETDMGRAVIGKLHKVRIRKLNEGTRYRYRVFSSEVLDQQPYHVAYGNTVATRVFHQEPLTFSTPAADSDSVEFMVVNDVHGDTALMADLMEGFRKGHTDFVLFNGDMVDFMDNEEQLFGGCIDKSVELFAAETPFYMVRGNHESRGNFAKNYMRYFPSDTGKPYYTFRRGPVFFVVLDGGEDKPDSDIEYSGTSFCDAYREEQAEWLAEVVRGDDFINAPFRVVVIHVPPVKSTWHGPLHTNRLFLPILNEAGIDLMLCGHLHRHIYNEAGADGAAFPILINSNREALEVSADSRSMDIVIKDRDGKERKKLHYTRK